VSGRFAQAPKATKPTLAAAAAASNTFLFDVIHTLPNKRDLSLYLHADFRCGHRQEKHSILPASQRQGASVDLPPRDRYLRPYCEAFAANDWRLDDKIVAPEGIEPHAQVVAVVNHFEDTAREVVCSRPVGLIEAQAFRPKRNQDTMASRDAGAGFGDNLAAVGHHHRCHAVSHSLDGAFEAIVLTNELRDEGC